MQGHGLGQGRRLGQGQKQGQEEDQASHEAGKGSLEHSPTWTARAALTLGQVLVERPA